MLLGIVSIMACGQPDGTTQNGGSARGLNGSENDSYSHTETHANESTSIYHERYLSGRELAEFLAASNERLKQQAGADSNNYLSLSMPVGYTFRYPSGWRIENCTRQYCSIFSYAANEDVNPANPDAECKIELYLTTNNDTPYFEEWPEDVLASIDIRTRTLTGKKVWMIDQSNMGSPCLATSLTERNRRVTIFCWPYTTRFTREYDEVVRSFRFIW